MFASCGPSVRVAGPVPQVRRDRTARWSRWKNRSLARRAETTWRASRCRRAISSSFEPAMRGRWRRCLSTIVWTSCRLPASPRSCSNWSAIGPSGTQDAKEAFALGRVYRRAGLDRRAQDAFAHALDLANPKPSSGLRGVVRVSALHALALGDRRARRHAEAAARWRALLETPDCPSHLMREAAEALAIHHEHRVRDLPVARSFALRSLEREGSAGWREAVRRRLTRLDRKIEGTVGRTVIDPPLHRLWSQIGPGD